MDSMFLSSKFNNDISQWNTSNVENMKFMFRNSQFNRDISEWNISKVITMFRMFHESSFQGDLTSWTPYLLINSLEIFNELKCITPYWANLETNYEIHKAIEKYQFYHKLNDKIKNENIFIKKNKI